MLLDEQCYILAIDFDKADWRADVRAVMNTCRRLGIPAALEISRSGQGGHIWLFFEQAIPAVTARKLGSFVLTETMEERPDLGLDSYDRFFPNQDTLPSGGFGNLIALPLQREPRKIGRSVFVDAELQPYQDQWAFLSSIQRISLEQVETLVQSAERKGRIVGVAFPADEDIDELPWTVLPSRERKALPIKSDLPKTRNITLGDEVYIAKSDLPPGLRNRLLRLAAFQNPEFYKAQAMRLPTYGTPRIIACAEDHPLHVGLPRGCLDDVRRSLRDLNIDVVLDDQRCRGEAISVRFEGRLRSEQKEAVHALAQHDTGVLSATTAFGKTVVAARMIVMRGVNTLILVHREQLMEQWVERLSTFLDLPVTQIGRLGGGRKKMTGKIDVALIQSLVRKGVVKDWVGEYGHLIVDECHHLPAASFEQVARRAKAMYVLGLSATLTRKDGHHPIITMQCGPVRYRVDAKKHAAARPFTHAVFVRPTTFRSCDVNESDKRLHFNQLLEQIVGDEKRNRQIRDDVVDVVKEGRTPLVLTERTEHLDRLEKLLIPVCKNVFSLKGGLGKRQLQSTLTAMSNVPDREQRVLLATGKYIGEGFDDPRLDTLFLTSPVSWRGTIAQYAGRLHRLHDQKTSVRIYDYADLNEPMLARMFDRRCKGYEAIGYVIQLPASAVPGWPPDVPLPIDPEWKRDYAASIQRLIRDGVDTPLADLFVHAARRVAPDATGEDRARSSTERFLFRRLETLSVTKGKFQLNANLPIAFDGVSSMEVDLLCPALRLAIELDGPHHFGDPAAYRRDRRKDMLLQEHGYLVLRFLAVDVGMRLDLVLDSILRAMAVRER